MKLAYRMFLLYPQNLDYYLANCINTTGKRPPKGGEEDIVGRKTRSLDRFG